MKFPGDKIGRKFYQCLPVTGYLLLNAVSAQVSVKHKIMIIPFEPRLYMSQVDHKFNAETKLNQKQIKTIFRNGINDELSQSLKGKYEVLNLLKDTTKYNKDLSLIYKNLSYSFDKVPDQSHYTAPLTEKEKKNQNIKNGQLVVETDPNAKFMNAKITSAGMIPGLFGKYKTDLFLFVTQLDIIANTVISNDISTVSERMMVIHYSVYTVDAKEIQAGTCSIKFPADANNPVKIVSGYLRKIASEISRRITFALRKPEEKSKGK